MTTGYDVRPRQQDNRQNFKFHLVQKRPLQRIEEVAKSSWHVTKMKKVLLDNKDFITQVTTIVR